jgi:hypothetical protein
MTPSSDACPAAPAIRGGPAAGVASRMAYELPAQGPSREAQTGDVPGRRGTLPSGTRGRTNTLGRG